MRYAWVNLGVRQRASGHIDRFLEVRCPGMLKAHSILTFALSRADTVTITRRLIRSVAGPVTMIRSCGRHCLRRGLGFVRFMVAQFRFGPARWSTG